MTAVSPYSLISMDLLDAPGISLSANISLTNKRIKQGPVQDQENMQ